MGYRYLDTYYNKNKHDTYYNSGIGSDDDYPRKLCRYVFQKFGMQKSDVLLDAGCGRGEYVRGFNDLGLNASGIDRENSGYDAELNIRSGFDIEKDRFPFDDDHFDFVFSKSVIAHLWNPDNFIKEIRRILKPGGKIIITTPDWNSQMHIFYDDFTKVHPYTPVAVEKLLKTYGFSDARADLFYTKPIFWEYPWLKIFSRLLQLFGPPKKIHKNQFIRWSRELMVLGSGVKQIQ